MYAYSLLALAASLASVSAATFQGFNYGTTFTDGSFKQQSDFENDFTTAQQLQGTNGGFTSARLYTMIQGGSTNDPTSAIPAAIKTKTTLLLGLWASGGQTSLDNELAALKSAISQYGSDFTDLIAAISVGSEDLYRISPTGIENMSGVGAGPDTLVSFISQTRSAISGTAASKALIGHVDTWTAWVNGSNAPVVEACDFVGVDAYPYFQTTDANSIQDGSSEFFDAYYATVSAAQGKPVWVTETGWPVSGSTANLAVPSIANAKTYWDAVGCALFGNVNTYWFTLQDADPTTPNPSFGLIGSTLTTTPLYDLTCPAHESLPAPSSAASSATASSSPSSTKGQTVAPYQTGQSGSSPGSAASSVASNAATASTSTQSGAAMAPTVRLAGLGMGVVAAGAAFIL